MKLQALLVLSIVTFGGAALAATSPTTGPVMHEGLVPVQSRNLDKFYVRPDANLAGYRKVMIDPVQVDVRAQMHAYNRIQSPAVSSDTPPEGTSRRNGRGASTSRI